MLGSNSRRDRQSVCGLCRPRSEHHSVEKSLFFHRVGSMRCCGHWCSRITIRSTGLRAGPGRPGLPPEVTMGPTRLLCRRRRRDRPGPMGQGSVCPGREPGKQPAVAVITAAVVTHPVTAGAKHSPHCFNESSRSFIIVTSAPELARYRFTVPALGLILNTIDPPTVWPTGYRVFLP